MVIIRFVVALIAVVFVLSGVGYAYEITFWDWLQLLIIPAVLAGVGIWFNWAQKQREQAVEAQRAQDAALQAYLDQMSQLLIDQPLRRAQPGDDLSTVARARTLTVLGRLDGYRKSSVLQFLRESGLIEREQPIIDLKSANLSDADSSGADLSGADLSGANLSNANLFGADLSGVNLRIADLRGANLSFAHLRGADLAFAHLNGADLGFARLSDANLSGAYLIDADMSGAYLVDADVSGANLTFADLSDANLNFADLSDTDLGDADLTSADLSAAKVTDEQLAACRSLKSATMPDGSKHN